MTILESRVNGQRPAAYCGYRCAMRGVCAPRFAPSEPSRENIAMPHPYKQSLGTLCLCVLWLFCAAPAHSQENGARKVVKKAPVQYPSILKSKGIGGVVRLKVFVKPDGTVRDTEVIGGNPILAESAQKSVMQWKFSPGSSETIMEVSVVFDPRGNRE